MLEVVLRLMGPQRSCKTSYHIEAGLIVIQSTYSLKSSLTTMKYYHTASGIAREI